MQIEFDWDPAKAASNARKNGVRFEDVMVVLEEPLAKSILDRGPDIAEEGWTTMGEDRRRSAMKDEYGFSSAERGRFYRPDAKLLPPVHLAEDVLAALVAQAKARDLSLDELVNELLRKPIETLGTF